MTTFEEIAHSFERQTNIMRNELMNREYENLVKSADLLVTYLKVKLGEVDKESENGNL